MANAIWQATIVDQSGNVLPGAEVEVVDESTGLSAPLFTTRTGTTKSNPFFADANGFAQFYAAPGLYRITATSSGTGTTMTWRNVRLVEVGTAAGEIQTNSQNRAEFAAKSGGVFTTDINVNGLKVGRGGGNASSNTASGRDALYANTTGLYNTASGYKALGANTTGAYNTASGGNALSANTTGGFNTANGLNALSANTTGSNNTASGNNALRENTTGGNNTANGRDALNSNTTGINNTASGYAALYANTTGYLNTANGYAALYANTTGNSNTANGNGALNSNTSGHQNTASGGNALLSNTTGDYNTASGYNALAANTTFSNCSGFGYSAQVTGDNQVQLGNSSTTTYAYGTVQNRSDIRDKTDVRDTALGLDFINALRPVDFRWDMREDYRQDAPNADDFDSEDDYKTAHTQWLESVKLGNIEHDGTHKRSRYHHGLIAQEVKSVIDTTGIDFGGFQDHKLSGGDDVLSLGYEELIAPLIKAVQELTDRIDTLESKE